MTKAQGVLASPRAGVCRFAIAPVLLGLVAGGCASLDARPELERSAAAVEHATGVPSEWLLLDSEAARARTTELLAEGVTREEAMQLALLNNPRARAALSSVGISRADFVQSTLFSNPTLALAFRFPDGGGLANFEGALAQNIAELWLMPARREVAQRRLDRAVLQAARTLAGLAFDARRAYTRAARAREEESISHDTLGITARLLEIAELRRRAGTGNEIDVGLAHTKKLQAETLLRSARLATIEAYSELARALGIPDPPDSLRLSEDLLQPRQWSASAESLQRMAHHNRLDLRMADQSVAEAEAMAREERVRFLKVVHAGVALERDERRKGEQGGDIITGPTLGIELPLWDHNQAQITRADRLLEQTLQFRDALLIDVAQDIYSRLARARTAAENAVFYRDEQLPAAEGNVALSREAYRAGRLPFLEILEAERTYLAARSGYLDALESAALATIELERITGRPAAVLLAGPAPEPAAPRPEPHAPEEVEP